MGFKPISCHDHHAIGAGIDKWLLDIPEPEEYKPKICLSCNKNEITECIADETNYCEDCLCIK